MPVCMFSVPVYNQLLSTIMKVEPVNWSIVWVITILCSLSDREHDKHREKRLRRHEQVEKIFELKIDIATFYRNSKDLRS